MSEEDDWFERALRDIDSDSDATADEGDGETDGEVGDADEGAIEEPEPEPEAETGADGSDDQGREREDGRESDPFGGIRDGDRDPARDVDDDFGGDDFDDDVFGAGESGTSESADDSTDDGGAFDGDTGGSDPFGGEASPSDAGGEDEPVDDPFGGGSSGEEGPFGGGSFGEEDPFGGGGGGSGGGSFGDSDPFGGGSGGGGGGGGSGGASAGSEPTGGAPASGGAADPFGGYRGNAAGGSGGPGGSGDLGFGEFEGGEGGDGSPEFDVDPDEFESSIERTDVGIEGLDEMILGGVPRRSLLSVIGGAGTGKTTFALQFLNEALKSDRKGIYITLEQTRESILSTAEEKGWSFREHADEDRLAVVAIDPIEMANSLASIRNDLTRLISEFDADRLVLDSVSLLEMMYDHPAKRRSEVFGFTRSLKNAGVTTLLTSEASKENPYASRHGIVEYLTDAVFVLQYIRGTDFRETRLAVEIQKIRDANHSRQSKPYDITDSGISVYGQANIF